MNQEINNCLTLTILQGAKKSYDSVVKENTELKKYIENIKQRYQQYQQQEQQEYFDKE